MAEDGMYRLKKPDNEPTLTESIVDGAISTAIYGAFAAVALPVMYVLAIPFCIVAMPFIVLSTLYLGALAIFVGNKDKESES
jgi:hypothetical protein